MKNIKTYDGLKLKATDDTKRMPPIKNIHALLEELGINHSFSSSTNVVEYRSKGRMYVNSRHMGKKGYELEIENLDDIYEKIGVHTISMNTADSYYSYNSYGYAQKLCVLIEFKIKKLRS